MPCSSFLAVFGIGLSLSACTSLGGADAPDILSPASGVERKEMTGLEDMSLEYIKAQWGEPDSDVAKGEGRILHYKNVKSQDLDTVEGDPNIRSCLLRLELNKEQIVTAWEYESCRTD